MNPNDIQISPAGTGSTREEVELDRNHTVEILQSVYPHLDALAEAWKAIPEENIEAKAAAWEAYLALDAKRCELDDHLAAQNLRLMNEF